MGLFFWDFNDYNDTERYESINLGSGYVSL